MKTHLLTVIHDIVKTLSCVLNIVEMLCDNRFEISGAIYERGTG